MAHPRMYDDADPTLRRLREICLSLPETFEKEAWGECTFRVTGGSMFAMTAWHHHGSPHTAVWIKATHDLQEMLVSAAAERFFVPAYVGPKGWVGVRLDYEVDWEEIGDLLRDAHAMSAPKRLLARLASAPTAPRRGAPAQRSTAGKTGRRTAIPPARRRPKR